MLNVTCRRAVRFFRRGVFAISACALLVLGAARAQNGELRIAAAADLKFVMDELAEQYKKLAPVEVRVTYGSSGNFFSQIQNGAPFDLFFSADIDSPKKLKSAGFAEPGSIFTYAIGRIVLWAPADSKLDVAHQHWSALLDAGVNKI